MLLSDTFKYTYRIRSMDLVKGHVELNFGADFHVLSQNEDNFDLGIFSKL